MANQFEEELAKLEQLREVLSRPEKRVRCAICQKEFVQNHGNHIYCSYLCAEIAPDEAQGEKP